MKIIMIAAMDEMQGIGLKGRMPWNCPADLRHFRQFTMNQTLIMGRKTWQGLPSSLPGRRVIVMSSDPGFQQCEHFRTLQEAQQWIKNQPQDQSLIIAGGAQIYKQWIDSADELVLSRIPGNYHCDTFFPDWDLDSWQCIQTEQQEGFTLEIWKRAA